MYESSSESSIEHGNFQSVINLYVTEKKDESISNTSDYVATDSNINTVIRYQPISYIKDISQQNCILPMFVPVKIHKNSKYSEEDRVGNCGSPISSSSESNTDSDSNSNAVKERRSSTTSTSTNSSDEDQLSIIVHNNIGLGARILENSYSTQNRNGTYQLSNIDQSLIHHPLSKSFVQANHDSLHGAQSSPSSRTASSSNSSKTVRPSNNRMVVEGGKETHIIIGNSPQSWIQNRPDRTISKVAPNSIGIKSQAVDSGISNTTPETQSSTEFYQRKLQDTIVSGKPTQLSSGKLSVPSMGVTGTRTGLNSVYSTRIPNVQYPQSVLKLSKEYFSFAHITADFKNYLFNIISTMYALLLLTISIILPVIEITSPHIFLNAYEGFYIFLYVTGIIFLIYIYGYLVRDQALSRLQLGPLCSRKIIAMNTSIRTDVSDKIVGLRPNNHEERICEIIQMETENEMKNRPRQYENGWGGLLLRFTILGMGVVNMIRDGLMFGRVLDSRNSSFLTPQYCRSSLVAVRCLFSMIYTFIQLYFIFINSKISSHRFPVIARLGLMHMISVNLSSLFRTVIKDSIFEQNIKPHLSDVNQRNVLSGSYKPHSFQLENLLKLKTPLTERVQILQTTTMSEKSWFNLTCRGGDLMDGVFQASDPYIYPFCIQYCLITAAFFWVSWRNIENQNILLNSSAVGPAQEGSGSSIQRRQRHLISSTKCVGFKRGIFVGLITIVATIVDLVVFHILVQKPNHRLTAMRICYSFEIVLIVSSMIAIFIAYFKMQDLLFQPRLQTRYISIISEEMLLLISMVTGVYLYTVSNMIVGQLNSKNPISPLLLMGSLLSLLQASVQNVFVYTGLRKVSYKTIHERDKPGRELVVFLVFANTALWCLNLFEQRKLDHISALHHKIYGQWSWAIISHLAISMILMFRTLSVIALVIIWKQAYLFG